MRRLSLLAIFLLFFISGSLWHGQTTRPPQVAPNAYQDFFPESQEWRTHTDPFPYMEVLGPQRNLLGYVILTSELHLNITGYAGPTPLAIALNPKGEIINLRALPNDETSSYTVQIGSFLKKFLGATSARTLKVGEDVDAITHATITSKAITSTIRETLKHFSSGILKHTITPTTTTPDIDGRRIFIPLTLLTLAITALCLQNTFLRWGALIGGFIYFGLITQTMLSLVQVANIGLGNIPNFLSNPLWFLTLGIAFCGSLVIGRIYCGALCPFAFVQEILNKGIRRPHLPPPQIHHRAKAFKYIFLFLILGICFATGNPSAADMEPFVTLFAAQGTKLAWGLLGFMLILAIFYHRFWCVYLCPVGALTGLFAKISFFKIKALPTCTRCDLCISRCPTKAIQLSSESIAPSLAENPASGGSQRKSSACIHVDESECILCGKCLQTCSGKHLNLRPFYHDGK